MARQVPLTVQWSLKRDETGQVRGLWNLISKSGQQGWMQVHLQPSSGKDVCAHAWASVQLPGPVAEGAWVYVLGEINQGC